MKIQSALMIRGYLRRAGRRTICPMKDRARQPSSSRSSHIRAGGYHAEVFRYLAVYNVGEDHECEARFKETTKTQEK
jgi:hypothetical protein